MRIRSIVSFENSEFHLRSVKLTSFFQFPCDQIKNDNIFLINFIRFLIIFTWLSNGLWGRMFPQTNARTKLFVATQYFDTVPWTIICKRTSINSNLQYPVSTGVDTWILNMTNKKINDHVMNCFLTQQDTICCGNNGYSF